MIKNLEKAAVFFLYLYALFAPHSIFLAEASIIGGLVLTGFKIVVLRVREGKWVWKKGNLEIAILSFCLVGIFSVFGSYDRSRAISHIKSLWLVLFYFLIINTVERKDVLRLTLLLIISTTFASIHGLTQYFLGHTRQVQAFIKNVITLAGFFLLVTPISFAFFLGEKILRRKIFYLITFILLLFGLIFTLERSVWLGAGIVLVTFLLKDRRSFKVILPAMAIAGVLFYFSPVLRERARVFGDFKNYTISSRFHQWQSGLEMMFDHPLTGVGPGNYDTMYKQYKFFEERKTYTHAHSNIVQIGAETGILGLSIFFWMMVVAFKAITSRIKELPFSLPAGILAAFLGFHFAGLFEYNFGDSEVQLLLWFILGSVEKL